MELETEPEIERNRRGRSRALAAALAAVERLGTRAQSVARRADEAREPEPPDPRRCAD